MKKIFYIICIIVIAIFVIKNINSGNRNELQTYTKEIISYNTQTERPQIRNTLEKIRKIAQNSEIDEDERKKAEYIYYVCYLSIIWGNTGTLPADGLDEVYDISIAALEVNNYAKKGKEIEDINEKLPLLRKTYEKQLNKNK